MNPRGRKPLDSRAIIDLIVDIETRYPVDQWEVDGLKIWPAARTRWYNLILHHHIGTGAVGAGARSTGGFLGGMGRTIATTMGNRIADRGKNARPEGRHEAVLFSDGVSLAKVEGEYYDRFMDPIIAELAAGGHSSLLLMPMAPGRPRHTPSLMIQPRLDTAKLASTVKARLSGTPPHRFEGLEEALPALGAAAGDVDLPGPGWLMAQGNRIAAMAQTFDRVLRKTSARLAFVNTYYSAEGMAFTLAARRRGCITIDVQHGGQVDHIAYHRWSKVPAGGYELLPHLFWSWSDREAAAIRAGFGSDGPHQATVAGNLWWRVWADSGMAVAGRLQREIKGLKQRAGARFHVLVTHTWGHTKDEWQAILQAMAKAPDDLHWWLRLHPMQLAQREQFRAELEHAGVRHVELDAATDYPLPLLLGHMDVNVTESSSTVLEAMTIGVPSVITTRHGANLFDDEIAAGRSRFANDPEAILTAIAELAGAGRIARPGGAAPGDPALLRAALADALARGCRSPAQPVSPPR